MFITRLKNAFQDCFDHSPRLLSYSKERTRAPQGQRKNHLVSRISHIPDKLSLLRSTNRNHRLQRGLPRSQHNLKENTWPRRIPRWLIAEAGLAIGKRSTSFSSTDTGHKWTVPEYSKWNLLEKKHSLYTCAPIQYTPLDRYINGSVCKAPAHPPRELLKGSVQSPLSFSKCRNPFYPSHTNSLGSRSSFIICKNLFPPCQLLPTLVLKDPRTKTLLVSTKNNLSNHRLY